MPSNTRERCLAAREDLCIPPFPMEAIRTRIARSPVAQPAKRRFTLLAAVSCSLIAVAAVAAVSTQSHIRFVRSGGMVLSSKHSSNRAISSEAEIERAAAQMDFRVTMPTGLPPGSRPIRLYVGDQDVMAITYDLPGAWRASRHFAWVFLANPATMHGKIPRKNYALRTDHSMSSAQWNTAGEHVIVVSNGLTAKEVATMKSAMHGN